MNQPNPSKMSVAERFKDSKQTRPLVSGFYENLHTITGTRFPDGGIDLTDERATFAVRYMLIVENLADALVAERRDYDRPRAYRAITQFRRNGDQNGLYQAERQMVVTCVSGTREVEIKNGVLTIKPPALHQWTCGAEPLQIAAAAAYALLGEQCPLPA